MWSVVVVALSWIVAAGRTAGGGFAGFRNEQKQHVGKQGLGSRYSNRLEALTSKRDAGVRIEWTAVKREDFKEEEKKNKKGDADRAGAFILRSRA